MPLVRIQSMGDAFAERGYARIQSQIQQSFHGANFQLAMETAGRGRATVQQF